MSSTTAKEKLVGSFLVGYGLLKIFIGGTASMASEKNKDKIKEKVPLTKTFYSDDETLSGKAVEFSFFLFGIFSLLHGFDKFKLLPHSLSHVLEQQSTEVAVYSALGIGLVGFYSAVIYTDLPIPKIKENYNHYKILGVFGGLTFLLYPVNQSLTNQKKILGSYGNVWNSSIFCKVEFASLIGMLTMCVKMLYEGLNIEDKHIGKDVTSLVAVLANMF